MHCSCAQSGMVEPGTEFGNWNGLVEFSYAAMEAIRAQALNGFNLFPRGGGVEIGGVLYGERRGEVTRVIAAHELDCRHEMGPRFRLGAHDEADFRDLLKPRNGLRAVGWYCSHTRGGVTLNSNDCAILERYFPERGSVVLLVKPDLFGPMEATFHVQGYAEPGPHFTVMPPTRATPAVVKPAVVKEAAKEAVSAPEAVPTPPVLAALAAPVYIAPRPATPAAAAPVAVLTPAVSRALPKLPPGPPWLRWAGFGGGAAATVLALISLWPASRVATADARLGLQVFAIADRQVRIEWDRTTPAVRDARTATVEIVDGRSKYTLPLTAVQLRNGSLTYGHQTDIVDVRMRLATGAAESVKLVTVMPEPVASPMPAVEAKPSPLAPVRTAVVLPPAAAPPSAPQPVAVTTNVAKPEPTQADREEAPVAAPPSRKQFALAEQPKAESASVALPDPPPVVSATVRAPPVAPVSVAVKLPLPVPAAAPAPIVVHAAQSGRLIWTGFLERHGVVEFDASKPSVGSVSGTLPGKAIRLSAFPGEFKRDLLTVYTSDAAKHEREEAPGPLTGFNRLHFIWDPERVKQIAVVEAPTAGNQFARLILRNEGKSCRAILVEWRTE